MKKKSTTIPTVLILMLLFAPGALAQHVIGFSGGSFEGVNASLTFSAGEAVSGSFQNASIQISNSTLGGGSLQPTSVAEPDSELPVVYRLRQNYPNPFNPSTTISYDLPKQASVRLEVYNTIGSRIAVLENATLEAGTHNITFDASRFSSGVYLYRLTANGTTIDTRTMTLLK